MDEYISKVLVLKDALAATGEKLKESEIILITLGGLGEEFESFVTALTARYDPSLIFSELGELLMDHDMRLEKSRTSISRLVNVATKSDSKSIPKSDIKCQICRRKGHGAIDCYNRLNTTRFPTSHGRTLSPHDPNGNTQGSVNTVMLSSDAMTMWYPDSGDTSHIMASQENIQYPRAYKGNDQIFTVDGSPLLISQSGRSCFKTKSINFVMQDLLLVPSATRNLLSMNRFLY